MNNLQYVNKETKDYVEGILENPAVNSLTKAIIHFGLTRNSVKAVHEVQLAQKVLKLVVEKMP